MEHRYGPDDTTTHPEDGNYRQLHVCTQHLVGGGEVRVYLIELGPSRGLMATRV